MSTIADAASLLRAAQRVVVFTGAGVSAESGIPTYRSGANALWSAEKFERFANPRGYRAHLPESYAWYRQRALDAQAAQPNAAHTAIVELGARVPHLTVVTQNVDGLHVRAGSKDVIELHGHLRTARCADCGVHVDWSATPRCAGCDGMLRPNVVMFEEMLSERDLTRARNAAERCDVLMSVGTSNLVWPAKELPMVAHAAGASVIIVNPEIAGQPVGERIIHVPGRAGAILPLLL